MPRIRSLKPEVFASPQVMDLSLAARLLFIGLITQADDEGRGTADLRRLRAAVFPGEKFTANQMRELLQEICDQRLVLTYPVEGAEIYALPTWKKHQRINRPSPSGYPPPPVNIHATITARSVNAHGVLTGDGGEGSDGGERSDRSDRKDSHAPQDEQRQAVGGTSQSKPDGYSKVHTLRSPRSPKTGDRRNADFEVINADVLAVVRRGGFGADDAKGIARALHLSEAQAITALAQLRD